MADFFTFVNVDKGQEEQSDLQTTIENADQELQTSLSRFAFAPRMCYNPRFLEMKPDRQPEPALAAFLDKFHITTPPSAEWRSA